MSSTPITGHRLDFSATACKGFVGTSIEWKVCEGGYCGGLRFRRVVPRSAKEGVKVCATCAARLPKPERTQIRVLVRPTLNQRSLDQHWDREVPREMARLRA